ncbi:beta-ketoacyl-[acyl-carrier-protein] synthase family protein [Desulfogranum mediterraneum]|uniref:beta-ketoacyl-[acyl-carrier-protein] synthase family protein n=1 Tax=Desulfogranum mediterraneum TaxID=160661 RepID=UPI0004186DE3|nr:beta-ketoacyl-[acyl-carrier-protein] synthase family protein [Desulfogranum mediterraneum]
MSTTRIYINGLGIISGLGKGLAATEQALRENRSALAPLSLFSLLRGEPLPVGQVELAPESATMPRTHQLAVAAGRQAMAGCSHPPGAIILGTTTGGILTTEQLLAEQEERPHCYRYHGLHSVAQALAESVGCTGPALVVSTACSSGAVALALAREMLLAGEVDSVLAGGVDSLSRLTYFGFHALQLVDRQGCRPLDRERQGMAVAEGAGLLLLSRRPGENCTSQLLGAGLSCDAYHPAAPHPEGDGALRAMEQALADGGLTPAEVDYINLHGTGTPDNDRAEARAIRRLFQPLPPLSSIKGATGHSLAAAGAIEAVIASLLISRGLLPANTGLEQLDPELGLKPITRPEERAVRTVLSNSFGFGGNNGSLLIAERCYSPGPRAQVDCKPGPPGLAIHGFAAISGAGNSEATLERLRRGESVAGMASAATISAGLSPRLTRRLKRLAQMSLSLAAAARKAGTDAPGIGNVFMGTSWGALSETFDFLHRLRTTEEQFPSPTDFVGSVHNGPAGQVALLLGATGANITTSGGDYSFEQALLSAQLMRCRSARPTLLMGVDEAQPDLSPLLDPSCTTAYQAADRAADGGAALLVSRELEGACCRICLPFYQQDSGPETMAALVRALKLGPGRSQPYGLILVGIPAARRDLGQEQLRAFQALSRSKAPTVDYRRLSGEFGTASALAATLAAALCQAGRIPAGLSGGRELRLEGEGRRILILGLGDCLTAMELQRP